MTLKVLVLGASGFVGRKLVHKLATSGWAWPIAASRHPANLPGAQNVALDATDAGALADVVARADAVVNCVAGSAESMVAGAQALRTALIAAPGKQPRLVHFSSMAAYGSAIGWVDESAPLKGDLGAYSGAKAQTEQILADVPNVVVLRPGCVYGPGSTQWSERIARLLQARRIGDLGPAGDGYSNLVYIDDVIDAVLAGLRLDAAAGRAFNLSMRDAPTWNAYFVAYGRTLGAVPVPRITPRRLKIESKLAIPLKVLEKAAGKLRVRNTPPVLAPSMLALWQQDIGLLPDAAETTLGLSWTPLETGLRATS